MNIVFFGSAKFSIPSLEALAKSQHRVSCVVTQPDRKQGRGLHLAATPVKSTAQVFHLKLYQPERISSDEAFKFLSGFSADLFVVIAYGQILSAGILSLPAIFSLNVHASLLPLYRGAAPINWALIKGEKTTGITTIQMVEKMDAGPVISQAAIDIAFDDTVLSLGEKLAHQAAQVLLDSLEAIESKSFDSTPQDESKVTFAPKLKKEDALIDWYKEPPEIYNLVRGCLDWPTAFTYYKGKRLKIFAVKIKDKKSGLPGVSPGEIIDVSSEAFVVAAGQGSLLIEKIQTEAGRLMTAREFLAGHKIGKGDRLG
jgi:methionyl-tRNA formyltransferase